MTFDDLSQEYKKDEIDINSPMLDEVAGQIPSIHRKWLDILAAEQKELISLRKSRNKLRRLKWEYYSGKLDQETLTKMGWDQFNHKIMRTDLDKYLESDKDLQKFDVAIEETNARISYIESVLKEILNRNWLLRNMIEWRKFISGN